MFQQNGAPAHYGTVVQEWLNDKFGEKWIGHHSFIEWLPRSPDLSPCDFILRGALKNCVYRRNKRRIKEQKNEITTEILESMPIFVKWCVIQWLIVCDDAWQLKVSSLSVWVKQTEVYP